MAIKWLTDSTVDELQKKANELPKPYKKPEINGIVICDNIPKDDENLYVGPGINVLFMFTREEMLLLVSIATGDGTKLEIKERLYRWFARERSDLLRSAGIADKFDPKLESLAKLLKKEWRGNRAVSAGCKAGVLQPPRP